MGEPKAKHDDGANRDEDRQRSGSAPSTPAPPPPPSPPEPDPDSAKADEPAESEPSNSGIEVELLTYEVIQGLAEAVAAECGAQGRKVIVLTRSDAGLIAGAQASHALLTEIADRMLRLCRLKFRESAAETETEAEPVDPFKSKLDNLTSIAAIAQEVIATLTVTETRVSRSVAVHDRTLLMLVAGALLKLKAQPIVPNLSAALMSSGADTALGPAQAAARQLKTWGERGGDEATALLAEYSALVDRILGAGPAVAAGLAIVSIIKREDGAWLLAVDVVAAGGTTWERKHLGTALGLSEPLSFSAGAALSYVIIDGDTSALHGAGISYDWSGRKSLPRHVRLTQLTNLKKKTPSPTVTYSPPEN